MRVTEDGVGELASCDFDALNRRVSRAVAGEEHPTVWSGWRAIEEYGNDGLEARRVYGLGLDEIVRAPAEVPADPPILGVLLASSMPFAAKSDDSLRSKLVSATFSTRFRRWQVSQAVRETAKIDAVREAPPTPRALGHSGCGLTFRFRSSSGSSRAA